MLANNKYERFIVRGLQFEKTLTHHEGETTTEAGYPMIMGGKFVKEAKVTVAPCLMPITTQILASVKADKFGKAVPHIHSYDEMYIILGPDDAVTAEILLGEDTFHVSSPATVYIPAGLPHSIKLYDALAGAFGGVVVMVLNPEYNTSPIPENPTVVENPEHLIVRGIQWVENLSHHEGKFGEKGYPMTMNATLVPEAKASVLPCLMVMTEEMMQGLRSGALVKAVPHIHDVDEIYLVLGEDGAATVAITLGDEAYEVTTPAAVYIPAGLPHSIKMKDAVIGKYGGACPVVLSGEYTTFPVPENWRNTNE